MGKPVTRTESKIYDEEQLSPRHESSVSDEVIDLPRVEQILELTY